MAKFNHMFEVSFEVISDNDWEDVTEWELLEGIRRRLSYLQRHPHEVLESTGHCDTYSIEDLED